MSDWFLNQKQQERACELTGNALEAPLLCAARVIGQCELDMKAPQKRIALLLVLTILDLCSSAGVLLAAGKHRGIIHLLRGALEALADLRNLVDDPGYMTHIKLQEIHHVASSNWAFKKGDNKYVRDVPQMDQDRLVQIAKQREKEVKAESPQAKRFKLYERFQQARLSDEYDAICSRLSEEAHNGLTSMMLRHVDFETEAQMPVPASRINRSELRSFVEAILNTLEQAVDQLRVLAQPSPSMAELRQVFVQAKSEIAAAAE